MSVGDLIWIFFLLLFIWPMIRQRWIDVARLRLIRRIERSRGTRLITLIHRQESISLLGIPIARYIDIEDSEAVLRAIRLTDPQIPIDLIVHTPGGLVLAAEQIAHVLAQRPGPVTVFVPHYAMSGGTFIALSADEIVMDEGAALGPIDPQVGEFPAVSLLKVPVTKPLARVEDRTLILADLAEKAIAQVRELSLNLLAANGVLPEKAEAIAGALTSGRWTHDYPIHASHAREIGLPVKIGVPDEVYDLMHLYPQTTQRRPSVQYVPTPYDRRTIPPRSPREGETDRR
ncbi:MAG: ATP-dependent Clp protease proteolytic subunit [Chloroflexi bacterium]|nr:ATP-dependent Clp protease proteolytic subunit [Chloroflexota bacterium]